MGSVDFLSVHLSVEAHTENYLFYDKEIPITLIMALNQRLFLRFCILKTKIISSAAVLEELF